MDYQCAATTAKGNQCLRTATAGRKMCSSHEFHRKYYIKIQQRCPYNGRFAKSDWRAYRKFSVWPILFDSSLEAHDFMDECFTFKGINGRKMSASIYYTRVLFDRETGKVRMKTR